MGLSTIDVPAPSGVKAIKVQRWLVALTGLAKRQIGGILERRRVRRDAEALLAMDDRCLADIGLRRCEVEYATRHGRRPADIVPADDR
jgi:uncharacterized protein YjiS (DUF1127 family)